MQNLLLQASDALSRNDAEALEALCEQAASALHRQPGADPTGESGTAERAAYAQALLCFQRQVIAARSNLTLRQRLLSAHAPGAAPWVR